MTQRLLLGLGLASALALTAAPAARAAEDLKVGDMAPDFSLKGTDGKTYVLADFKGKKAVILAWFPKADTPGCTAECKSFSEQGEELKGMDVAYFTASVDTAEANGKFSDKFSFNFPILSDPDKTVAKAYGVLRPNGMANRWTYYIDKDGKVAAIEKKIDTKNAAPEVVAKLKSLGIAEKK